MTHNLHLPTDERRADYAGLSLRLAIVALTLATAYIHATLGGLRFTLNALGYVAFAAAMVAPFALAQRHRWLIRLGLAGYAATTIVGWAIEGPYYATAYVAKAIELTLIALLFVEHLRHDPGVVDRIRDLVRSLLGRSQGPALFAIALLVAAACAPGASGPEAERTASPDALRISAKDLEFSTDTLSAPAGEPFQIAFDNQESAPHNVAIYEDASVSEEVFGSQPFGGPASVVYEVPALEPGTYFFRCDVHPDMQGQLTAE